MCRSLISNISKPVTDIYLKQVTVEQHMKEIYYLKVKKAFVVKSLNAFEPPLSHTIAIRHEHFCAKLLGDCKDFDPDIFFALLHDIC